MGFEKQLLKRKIPSPVEKAFNLREWKQSFREHNNGSERDPQLYEFGICIWSELETIRARLHEIDLKDNLNFNRVALCLAQCNRDIRAIEKGVIKQAGDDGEIYLSATIESVSTSVQSNITPKCIFRPNLNTHSGSI